MVTEVIGLFLFVVVSVALVLFIAHVASTEAKRRNKNAKRRYEENERRKKEDGFYDPWH